MKAERIYNITMALIDEYKDNGEVDMASTKDYQARTPGILTQLSTIVAMEIRKYNNEINMPSEINKMSTDVELEDEICLTILPNGLAGRLLITEDTELANYFNSTFENQINNYCQSYKSKATIVDREDVYGASMRAGD